MDIKEKPRRRHSKELKARVVAACAVPGASVAAVAQSNALNANLVHQWRRGRGFTLEPAATKPASAPQFVALALPSALGPESPERVATAQEIRMELNRGALSVSVTWPVAAAGDCGVWLRELLR
jgi:transposase